jgi:hypothetical protein
MRAWVLGLILGLILGVINAIIKGGGGDVFQAVLFKDAIVGTIIGLIYPWMKTPIVGAVYGLIIAVVLNLLIVLILKEFGIIFWGGIIGGVLVGLAVALWGKEQS